ncbi:hypothetical protein CN423_19310 [Bacillus cereus]|uniref:Uncharacterized protein n=1 Tax=Bacillus thuringiensis TaxID=1428 RepID=A0AB36TU59_BACTU|nr:MULTISPECIES: hypothetical protein [Bacillus cereus group]WIK98147.1 hypothetical protein QPL86_11880 [Bacillus bombysepticus]PED02908.1 hypothetical protein CON14_10255 [Bacillus cereus]PEQ27251.1 hypothetical protein CN466_28430 [Bacillus cereus]PEV62894.1 hypothetical protein CN423_19310 [Bacillus cereus]PEX59146.1 hypothetical protein CN463_22815 [Bacillus cereus]
MYNNYWNPNQDVMYPNAVPNVDSQYHYSPNYIPAVDSNSFRNYHTPYPQYDNLEERDTFLNLSISEATRTDLGNGFYRFAWENRQINGNDYLTAVLSAGNYKVISAGYGMQGEADAHARESFPRDANTWNITVRNPTPQPRKIAFYLIAKI